MLALLSLLFIAIIILYTLHYFIPSPKTDFSLIQKEAEAFRNDSTDDEGQAAGPAAALFSFDPNTTSKAELKRLGWNDKVISNLLQYRQKGGRFYKPADITKIYGLTAEQSAALIPYIKIEAPANRKEKIDINTADSLQLLQVSGIGPAFSSRILHMRKALGAFVSKEQLKDIYGINAEKYSSIAPQLIINRRRIKKWNINTASLDELRANPYLSWKKSNAIVQYRTTNGSFQNPADLKKIYAIDDSTYKKLAPYITVE